MEVITVGVNNMNIGGGGDAQKKNRIQVSNTKKPPLFYVNLAKIEILLGKTMNFDESMAATTEESEVADGVEQS